MHTHTRTEDNFFLFDPDYRFALIGSFFLHLIFVIFAIYGLPHLKSNVPVTDAPISIEFIDVKIGDITQTDKIPEKKEVEKLPLKKKRAEIQKKIYTPPKMTAVTPPKIDEPKPLQIDNNEIAKARDVTAPDIDAVPLPDKKKIDDKKNVADKVSYAPKSTPKPNKKLDKKKVEHENKVNEESFNDVLLRNLAPEDKKSEKIDKKNDAPLTGGENAPLIKRLGDSLTISEQDAVASQLRSCWNFMVLGAKYPEDLVVTIKLFIKPDRTVWKTEIVDKSRYNSDSFFRAAVDSALRAVANPDCKVLNLPPEKYEIWKTISFTFDPRDVL